MNELKVEKLNITADMNRGQKNIVSDLSFSVYGGSPLAIVGESGCGKTMTALSVFGLLPENCLAHGEILLNGQNILKLSERKLNKLRGSDLVYIPQSGADFLNPSVKIKTQIYESLKKNGIKGKWELFEKASEILMEVGLWEVNSVLEKYPFQLSGGQAQRVVLAISLASMPKLVIADEPTKGIDHETALKFLEAVDNLFSEVCVIVITHDISVAKRCKNIFVMSDGKAVEYGLAEEVLKNPQNEITKELLKALPENRLKSAGN